jgi:glycine cleavage system transcriptional repressor
MNLAVTAIGEDRPGIVAGITKVLVGAEGNVDDSQMSILHGRFAVMLIVSVPDDCDIEGLDRDLSEVGADLGLDAIAVTQITGLHGSDEPTHVLSVYGPDRPGIVHETATLLADLEVNITDLRTRRTGSPDNPLYTLVLEVSVPGDEADLRTALQRFAESGGLEAALAELEAEQL